MPPTFSNDESHHIQHPFGISLLSKKSKDQLGPSWSFPDGVEGELTEEAMVQLHSSRIVLVLAQQHEKKNSPTLLNDPLKEASFTEGWASRLTDIRQKPDIRGRILREACEPRPRRNSDNRADVETSGINRDSRYISGGLNGEASNSDRGPIVAAARSFANDIPDTHARRLKNATTMADSRPPLNPLKPLNSRRSYVKYLPCAPAREGPPWVNVRQVVAGPRRGKP
ncbi:hypothetical protein KM043_005398 [Ampulex compressa]|nr:hypothetical protein KM043_005398 [Ampulex compressa]